MIVYNENPIVGRVYVMDSDAVTLASANATKSALGTAKFINGFYNPATALVYARILRVVIATVSGTPAGPFFYNFLLPAAAINSTATGTIRSLNPLQNMDSQMSPQTGVILTTVGALTTALSQLSVIGGPAAVAAGAGLYTVVDEPVVPIVIPPGYMFGLMCVGAGTTHVVQTSIFWEERKS